MMSILHNKRYRKALGPLLLVCVIIIVCFQGYAKFVFLFSSFFKELYMFNTLHTYTPSFELHTCLIEIYILHMLLEY